MVDFRSSIYPLPPPRLPASPHTPAELMSYIRDFDRLSCTHPFPGPDLCVIIDLVPAGPTRRMSAKCRTTSRNPSSVPADRGWTMNEADTCREMVRPKREAAGWNLYGPAVTLPRHVPVPRYRAD